MTTARFSAKAGDAELIARIRAGDASASETLVREHTGAMLAVARGFLRCEAESADAVQEAFILAFRALDSLEGNSALSSWLHRIVINRCLIHAPGEGVRFHRAFGRGSSRLLTRLRTVWK